MKIKNNFLLTYLLKLFSQFDKKFLKSFHVLDKVYFSILTLITITLSLANFTPNTILSGWDTLHPEFNFPLAISRSLSSAYQEHQGLGAVSAQSHLGDLPRILFLNLVSVVVPVESIRYFYIFLMLVLGPLGVYFFLKELFSQVSEKADYRTPAFMGALFYLCNLSVVQHFVVPLEMFVTLFGLLGFLFQAIYLNLRKLSYRSVGYLAVISLFIAPSAHTATLFYMTIFVIVTILFSNFIFTKDRKDIFIKSFLILSTIISVNAFWILPNLYFIFNQGLNVSQSKIHTLFSDLAYLSNLRYGNPQEVSLFKNYLFLWEIYDGRAFQPLLLSWILNLNLVNQVFGYLIFTLAIIGGGYGAAKKPQIFAGFLAALLLCAVFIASSRSPAGGLIDFIRENIPLMKEALRFPFNKFSTIFSLMVATLFSYFFFMVFSFTGSRFKKVKFSILAVYVAGSIYFFLPAFQGKLIHQEMRVKIPVSYFELFQYLDQQGKYGRVADFPVHSLYGWSYYDFKYQGAGFLWFGIKQPLLNREFDRWGYKNEDYYAEITQAIYNEDPSHLVKILNKYSIRWLLLDENLIAPEENPEVLYLPEIKNLLSKINKIQLVKKFDDLSLYEFSPEKDFSKTKVISQAKYLSNEHFRENNDFYYQVNGDYYSDFSKNTSFGIKNSKDLINQNLIFSDDENFYLKNIQNVKQPLSSSAQAKINNQFLEISSNQNNFRLNTELPNNLIYSLNSNLVTNSSRDLELSKVNKLESFIPLGFLPVQNLQEFISIGNCSGEEVRTTYSFEIDKNNLTVKTQNVEVCFVLNINKLRERYQFNSILFSSSISGQNTFSLYCENKQNSCDKNRIPSLLQKTFTPDVNEVIFFIRPAYGTQAQQIFENLSVYLLQDVFTQSFELSNNFYQENSRQVTIPKNFSFSGSLDRFGYSPRFCSSSKTVRQPLGVYESELLNICDNYVIGYKPGYYHLVEIRSKNYSGLPLRLCLQNEKTLRCSFTVSLPSNKELTSDYILLPPFNQSHNLAITNQVVESLNSKNEISYLSVIPIDYFEIFERNMIPDNTKIKNIFYYDNSFDRGFVLMCGLLPCNNPHILVNNWANGWVLEEGESIENFWILYWPNYLSLVGVLFFFIFLYFNLSFSIKVSKTESNIIQ